MSDIKDFHCVRCGKAVARTDGVQIYFDATPVPLNPSRIKFQCPHCRASNEWIRSRGGNLLNGRPQSVV